LTPRVKNSVKIFATVFPQGVIMYKGYEKSQFSPNNFRFTSETVQDRDTVSMGY